MRWFVVFVFLASSVFAWQPKESCGVDYPIMYLLAMNERHPKREIGYPFVISINEKKDSSVIRKFLSEFFIDNRTIDCKNKDRCVKVASILVKKGYTNIDLGAFQINYKWHRSDLETFFDIEKSYAFGCKILKSVIRNKTSITYEDIAKYHSFTKKKNSVYANKLRLHARRLHN